MVRSPRHPALLTLHTSARPPLALPRLPLPTFAPRPWPRTGMGDITGTLCVEGGRTDLIRFIQVNGGPAMMDFKPLSRCIDGLNAGIYQAVLTDRPALMWVAKTYKIANSYSARPARAQMRISHTTHSSALFFHARALTSVPPGLDQLCPRSRSVAFGGPSGLCLPRRRADAVLD